MYYNYDKFVGPLSQQNTIFGPSDTFDLAKSSTSRSKGASEKALNASGLTSMTVWILLKLDQISNFLQQQLLQ